MAPRRLDTVAGLAGAAFGVLAGGAPGAVLGAALAVVRTRPSLAWPIAALALAATSASVPDGQEATFAVLLLVSLHALGLARFADLLPAAAGLAGLLAAAVAGAALVGDSSYVPAVFIPASAWAAGRAIRERALLTERLRERAAELEAERDAHTRLSVRYERARIAAELHDIVGHAISVMVVQAGAGQRLVDRDPAAAREAFAAIGDAARQAEADMGRLVELLADREEAQPAPDIGLVEELVHRAAATGLDVTLRLEGERGGLTAETTQTAFRVVQESLTNAIRYAAGARVDVLVRGDRDGLTVEVVNAPAARAPELAGTGAGTGLRGLQDRVARCGGRFDAARTRDGGWRVRAAVPRRPSG